MMNALKSKQYTAEMLPGFAPEVGSWLWALEDSRCRTKELLDSIADVNIDWVAPESGLSIGTLLYHIAAIEADWLYGDILGSTTFPVEVENLFPYDVRDGDGKLCVFKGELLVEHIQRMNVVRRYFLATFDSMPVEEFRRCRDKNSYEVTPEWVVHHLMQHEAEHRGLIGELRLLAVRKMH